MKRLLIAVVLLTALTACSSSTDVAPTETIAAESSVVDAVSVSEISVIVGENSGPIAQNQLRLAQRCASLY